ncbi:hypothetical protein BDV25DRAFT_62280 [Aspergillus avenaceus]|uniref:Uncharacterized protein n=1 Tax=Aspergillus avenaceus TaxID=36643 RepID=A0A5N6THB7_ASPAV|nr:hypothetical protein BDV25DRAFT_62280 [Aspergillus avenaceus]
MRSGFQKPGAIPFLALLLFSLLSLVPSLAKEWDFYNIPFGYIGSYHKDVRQPSRIRDGAVDARSRIRATGSQCKSWGVSGYCLSDFGRIPRPQRAISDTPPRSSFEAATVLNDDPIAFNVEESSTFHRGVRAFSSFFFQQPGNSASQFPSIESATTLETAHASLTPTASNLSGMPVSPKDELLEPKHCSDNYTALGAGHAVPNPRILFFHLYELWQQVCHAANVYLGNSTAPYTLWKRSQLVPNMGLFTGKTPQQPRQLASSKGRPGDNATLSTSSPTSTQPFVMPTHSPERPLASEGHPKAAGHGSSSEPARGSCMAIVIGLVVGVMWF